MSFYDQNPLTMPVSRHLTRSTIVIPPKQNVRFYDMKVDCKKAMLDYSNIHESSVLDS